MTLIVEVPATDSAPSGRPGPAAHDAGQELGAHQPGHLVGVVEVPATRRGDVAQDHAGQEVGRLGDVDPGRQRWRAEVRGEEVGDQLAAVPVASTVASGRSTLGLGLAGSAGAPRARAMARWAKTSPRSMTSSSDVGVLDLVVEAGEEPAVLPGDDGAAISSSRPPGK